MTADLPSQPDLLDEIVAGYLRAIEKDENPSRDEMLARHPELAEELREFFADHDRMNRLAQPLCEQTLAHPAMAATDRIRYFGDYEVLDEIARGGMGVVFKARQVTLNRIVAIKMILSGQLASPADVERFHTEAEAAAKLDHPGIVPVYEVGLHEGQHYFSMGFVDGQSLSTRIANGPLPAREAAELVLTVAEAVQYAHEKGVVHRDLKPGNILLDLQGNPRITDFGLAKLTESHSDLTGTGQILGTPGYMPPEQAAAHLGAVGPSSDIYSLGAILYCLLTGRPPFQAATSMETLLQVQKQEPVPPRQLNPSIPLDLDTIVLKCLEKSPSRRYRAAGELADELQCYLEGRPIRARAVGSFERTWRWCKRNPALTGIAGLAGIIVVLSAALMTRGYYNEQLKSANASLADTIGEREAALALAAEKQTEVDGQHRLAVAAEKRTRQFMYSAHILLATNAVEASDPIKAYELLAPFRADDASVRGPEWDILWRRIDGDQYSLNTIPGSRAEIHAIQYHPYGQQLVTGSVDGTVTVWNVSEDKPRYFIRHSSPVRLVCFLHRGTGVVFLDTAGSLFHLAPDAQSAVQIDGQFADVTALHTWKRDGVIATCHLDGIVRTVRTPSSKNESHSRSPVNPEGGACLAVAHDGTMNVWRDGDAQPAKPRDLEVTPYPPYFAASAGIAIVSVRDADQQWQLIVVRLHDGTEIGRIELIAGEFLSLAVSPNGRTIAVGGFQSGEQGDVPFLHIHDTNKLSTYTELECRTGKRLGCVAFRGDGRQLAGSIDGSIEFWKVPIEGEASIGEPTSRATLAFNSEGTVLATIHAEKGHPSILLRNGWTGEKQLELPCQMSNVFDVTFDGSGRIVAAAGSQGVQTWDARTGEAQRLFLASRQCFRVKIDPTGRLVAGCGGGTTVWDSSTGEVVYERVNSTTAPARADDWNTGLAFSPDGQWLAVSKRFGDVSVFDTLNWEIKNCFITDFWVLCLTFSPDGTTLVGCGDDPHIWFWNPADGRVVKTLLATDQQGSQTVPASGPRIPPFLTDLVFSNEGRRFVVGHHDSRATIWSAVTDNQLLSLGAAQTRGSFCTVTMTRDGRRLATSNGYVSLW